MVVTSAWLRGKNWYYATIGTLGASLLAMFGHVTPNVWVNLAAVAGVFAFFFYIHTVQYITRTKSLDLTYQSPQSFTAFAAQNNLRGPLITTLKIIPYALFVAVIVVGIVGFLRT